MGIGCSINICRSSKKEVIESQYSTEEQALLSQTAPKIHLRCTSDVQRYNDKGTNIVYVFGGPGSMKGLIIEDLVTTYGFQVITGEEIILNYLPNRVANIVQYTQEIQDLIRDDPTLLQLDWVLNLIGAKLSTSTNRLFLIDLVPNLQVFQRVDQFMKSNVSTEMNIFCRRHPCLFALNLSVPEDKLVENAPGILMTKLPKSDDDDEKDEKNKNSKSGKDKEEDKNNNEKAFEGTDEADLTRFQRRHQNYMRSVGPFLNFFVEIQRLVTVDVVPKQKEYVWKRVNEFFRDHGFGVHSVANTVVLFVFGYNEIEGLDPVYYRLLKVSLSSILSDQDDHKVSLEIATRAISLYLHSSSPGTNHLILLDCLKLEDGDVATTPRARKLAFMEVRECYLDSFIKVKSSVITSRPYKRPFKSVSLTNNEVFLFPADTDTELCCTIALATSQPPDRLSLSSSKSTIRGGAGSRSHNNHHSHSRGKRSLSIKTIGSGD